MVELAEQDQVSRRPCHLVFTLSLKKLQSMEDDSEISNEIELHELPLRIDNLITYNEDKKWNHPIAELFRRYNIVEFLYPKKYLNTTHYLKGSVYVRYHQVLKNSRDYCLNDSSLTLVCTHKTRSLFQELHEMGRIVVRDVPVSGFYQVIDEDFPTQIVVLDELRDPEIAYPFTPFISDRVRLKMGLFRRLLREGLQYQDNEIVQQLIRACFEFKILTDDEFKEVNAMLQGGDERERRYVEIMLEFPYWQDVLAKKVQEGKMEGKLEGKVEGKIELITAALGNGADPDYLAKITRMPLSEILSIRASLV